MVVDEHSIRTRYGLPVRGGYFLELMKYRIYEGGSSG